MVNPTLIAQIKTLRETNYLFFMYQQRLFEEDDFLNAKKGIMSVAKGAVLGIVLGIVVNVQFKRIPKINFL